MGWETATVEGEEDMLDLVEASWNVVVVVKACLDWSWNRGLEAAATKRERTLRMIKEDERMSAGPGSYIHCTVNPGRCREKRQVLLSAGASAAHNSIIIIVNVNGALQQGCSHKKFTETEEYTTPTARRYKSINRPVSTSRDKMHC